MTPKDEALTLAAQSAQLAALVALYPDLKKHTGRWGKVAYYSPAANAQVTDYDSRFNCGCCNDSPWEVWPYVLTPHGKVYSDPPMMFLGERGYHVHLKANPGWDQQLTAKGINPALVERLRLIMPDPEAPDLPDEAPEP